MQKRLLFSCGLLTLALLLVADDSCAQVTVGGDNRPKDIEILKIVSTNGTALRLPRYTSIQLKDLSDYLTNPSTSTSEVSSARGLMCFDTTLGCIVIWNGSEWIKTINYTYSNGVIKKEDDKVVLGGDLTESTSILTDKFDLSFTGAGTFRINEDQFVVEDNTIQIGSSTNPVEIKLNDGFYLEPTNSKLSISSDDNGVAISNQGTTSAFKVTEDITTITTTKLLHNVDVSSLDPSKPIVMTAADKNGKIKWTNLTNSTKSFKVPTPQTALYYDNSSHYIPTSAKNDNASGDVWIEVSDRFQLPNKGKWLIMGRYKLYSRNAADQSNYHTYISVYNVTQGKTIYTTAQVSEKKVGASGAENYGSYNSPNLTAFVDATDANLGDTYVIRLKTAKPESFFSALGDKSWLGPQYLNVVQLRRED